MSFVMTLHGSRTGDIALFTTCLILPIDFSVRDIVFTESKRMYVLVYVTGVFTTQALRHPVAMKQNPFGSVCFRPGLSSAVHRLCGPTES